MITSTCGNKLRCPYCHNTHGTGEWRASGDQVLKQAYSSGVHAENANVATLSPLLRDRFASPTRRSSRGRQSSSRATTS